jgi:hypothetical protein
MSGLLIGESFVDFLQKNTTEISSKEIGMCKGRVDLDIYMLFCKERSGDASVDIGQFCPYYSFLLADMESIVNVYVNVHVYVW